MKKIKLKSVDGRRVFAVDINGVPLMPLRYVGCDSGRTPMVDGEEVDAVEANGKLEPKNALYRNCVLSGDLEMMTESE